MNTGKQVKKVVACAAAVAVLCGSSAALAFAAGAKRSAADTTPKAADEAATSAKSKSVATKDETVYVLAGADGTVEKIIVSDWIQNTLGADTLTDSSALTDPKNVKSDAGYTMNADNLRVWDAKGEDIYYQGTVEKELPVTLTVRYTLDGQSIAPSELAGKSGKVTMRFDYQNRQSETVMIDGKPTTIYVPFVMLTGMILDNDVFRNVTVSGGKLINDGDHSVVMGVAMPGLQEDLALDKEKLDIPDYVEITADVTNFSLTTTLTLATNEIFSGVDTDKLNSLDDLTAQMDDLTDAMSKLMDGSSKLYSNLKVLTEQSKTLVSSINQLAAGASQLADGAHTAADGAAQVRAGMAELSAGLQTLTANSGDLTAGAKQVFDTLLLAANTQIAAAGLNAPALTVDNYAQVLGGVIDSLDEATVRDMAQQVARETVTAKVNEQEDAVRAGVTQAVQAQVLAGVLATQNMTVEQYQQAVAAGAVDAQTQAMIDGAVAQQMQSEQIQATINANVDKQKAALVEQAMASDEVAAQIAAAVEKAKAGAGQLVALKTQLDSYNTFYQGVLAYTAGAGQAASGAVQLADATGQLSDGAAQLATSADTLAAYLHELQEKSAALPDGAQQLTDGAMQLSDGLKQLNEQGIAKLADAVNGDLNGLLTRLRATVDVSKNYRSFAGLSDDMDGQVRFVYRTDSIEAAS